MVIDGKSIAESIKHILQREIQEKEISASLAVFSGNEDLATRKFVEIKKRFAADIGIPIREIEVYSMVTKEIVSRIQKEATTCDGIIVQFPLPPDIDTDVIRNAIPVTHDIDVISDSAIAQFKEGKLPVLPPVVGAIAEIVRRNNVVLKDKRVVIVGEGQLVGKPASIWARLQGADVTTLNAKSFDTCPPKLRRRRVSNETGKADILILGAGVPHLIKPEMIKKGVVIFDAGTSEEAGRLVGDADSACAQKASLFTPVPGGIGPITIAIIFKNLLTLIAFKI